MTATILFRTLLMLVIVFIGIRLYTTLPVATPFTESTIVPVLTWSIQLFILAALILTLLAPLRRPS